MTAHRRKSVPSAWREEHHYFSPFTRRSSLVGKGRGRFRYRSGGVCSCGQRFGLSADQHNMDLPAVMNAYNDHVAKAYHGENYTTDERGQT